MPPEHVRPSPGAHVGADQVADLLEDLLPQADAEAVTAHLDSCTECSLLRSDLAALPALLAAVPTPSMPAEVAARLDAAVADAAARREDHGARPSTVTATVTPLDSRRRRFVARTFTGVAAAAALVVGVLVVGDVGGVGGGTDESAGGGSSAVSDQGAGEGAAEDGPAPESRGGLARLTSEDFKTRAADLFFATTTGDSTASRDGNGGSQEAGACSPRDLRAARISGSLGPPALLDREPVTLVSSGPRRRSLVVAYSCATGRPVEQQRALIDLTD